MGSGYTVTHSVFYQGRSKVSPKPTQSGGAINIFFQKILKRNRPAMLKEIHCTEKNYFFFDSYKFNY